MDILIKSFNRPFYLERALSSIEKFVTGKTCVKVLDDGTPQKYLDKIQSKFPEVIIIKSDSYIEKSEAIKRNLCDGTDINGFRIPVDLWIQAAKNASPYFIMTEDDVWFTEPVNLISLQQQCEQYGINLLKLGWLGNSQDDAYLKMDKLTENINTIIPQNLFLSNRIMMEAFFYNYYKFYTLLYKLGKVDNHTRQKYWALNSILMGLYKKEYWLEIWRKMNGKVDEKRQLINASTYYRKKKHNPNFVARLKKEVMKTTFQSSATNSYHEYGYNFDVNYFNHLLNEAWYSEQLDSLQNFPNDFEMKYFEKFADENVDIREFRKWVVHFRNQYEKLGANVH